MPSLAGRNSAPGTNERKYPHVVQLAVGKHGLDVEFGRRIMHFHNLQHIKPRHGHIVFKEGQTHYRCCFSDLAMAHAFIFYGRISARPRAGAALYSPSTRRRCSSRISSAIIVRDNRTSSTNGVFGQHDRQDSAGMRLVTAAWR